MTNCSKSSSKQAQRNDENNMTTMFGLNLNETRIQLGNLKAEDRLNWAHTQFGHNFVLTTSFGIQSAVLLHMVSCLKERARIPIIWVDTGYMPSETYQYAEKLINQLDLDLKVAQSLISPARMEALYGRLWETGCIEDLEKYHQIRKVNPLEQALNDLNVQCWASGVRGNQTDHRSSMTWLDPIRGRLSLRPLLNWTQKNIFYYMEENNLPQHPLFEQGYSSVGDWHSSAPDGVDTKGRATRFSGLKQECGIHLPGPGMMGEGI